MQASRTIQVGICWLMALVWLVSTVGAHAQMARDEQLIGLGRTAVQQQRYAEAVPLLETLHQQFPTSPYAAEGSFLLFRCYLSQGKRTQAEPLWQEALAKWTRTETMWQFVEAYATYLTTADPANALPVLDDVRARDLLPDGTTVRLQRLRLRCQETINPAQYLTDALAVVLANPAPTTMEAIQLGIDTAGRLYRPLMRAGRYDEAHAVFVRVQQLIPALEDPTARLNAVNAYLEELERSNPARFLPDVRPVIAVIEQAMTLEDCQLPMRWAARAYPYWLQQGQGDEATKYHTLILQQCQLLGAVDAARTDTLAFQRAQLSALEKSDPTQFLTDLHARYLKTAQTTQLDDLILPMDYVNRFYRPMMAAGRLEEAQAAHEAIRGALTRLKNPNNWGWTERNEYWRARLDYLERNQPELFMTEGVAMLKSAIQTKVVSELPLPVDYLARVCNQLMQAGRFEEAQAVYDECQAALQKLNNPNNWAQACATQYAQARWGALVRVRPAQFLTDALGMLAQVGTTPQDPATGQLAVDVARLAYTPLLRAERYADATAVYAQAQTLCQQLQHPDWSQQHDATYANGIVQALDTNPRDELLTHAMQWLATVPAGTPAAETVRMRLEVTKRLYRPLCRAGRTKDAAQVYAGTQAFLEKAAPDQRQGDTMQYLQACSDGPSAGQVLPQALTALGGAAGALAPDTIALVQTLATRAYADAFTAQQAEAVAATHTTVQTWLTQHGTADQVQTDTLNFLATRFAALESQPQACAADVIAFATATAKTPTPAAVALVCEWGRRLYDPLLSASQFEPAFTLHRQVQTLCTAVTHPDWADLDRGTYLDRCWRVSQNGISDAALLHLVTWVTQTLDTPVPADAPRCLEVARRIDNQLWSTGRRTEAMAMHAHLQTVLAKVGSPEQRQQERFYYEGARVGVLLPAQRAQYSTEASALIDTLCATPDAATTQFCCGLTEQIYITLAQSGQATPLRALHARMQTLCATYKLATLAQTETETYMRATQQILGNPGGDELFADIAGWLTTIPNQPTASEVPIRAATAGRIYGPLCQAGRFDMAQSIHAAMETLLARGGQRDLLATDTQAYVTAVLGAIQTRWTAPGTTMDDRTAMRTAGLAIWASSPDSAAPGAVALVDKVLQTDPTTGEWVPAFATLVNKLPKSHPSRPAACLLLGQWAQRLAALGRLQGTTVTPLDAAAEQGYRTLVQDYPTDANSALALAQLAVLYQSTQRVTELEALIDTLPPGAQRQEMQTWVAEYYFQRNTADGYGKALPIFTRLLTTAPTSTQCPVWQFKVARCLEQAGKTADAVAAYQRIIDTYPDSTAVVAAMRKIEQLKGGGR